MKTKVFRPVATVRLPRMTSSALIALLVSLRTAMQEARSAQVRASKASAANATGRRRKEDEAAAVPVPIPAGVTSCMKRINAACDALEREARTVGDASDRKALRGVARRYAQRWQALRSFVNAFVDLDAVDGFDPGALRVAAERVLGTKKELTFLRGADHKVWAAGRQKLALIESEGVASRVAELGGALVLAQLRAEHDAYGAAIGVTEVARNRPAPRSVGALMEQARALVSEYALKVSAMVDAEVPGSEELAEALLAPIMEARRVARPAAKAAATTNGATKAPPKAPPSPSPAQPVVAPVAAPAVTPAEPLRPTGT